MRGEIYKNIAIKSQIGLSMSIMDIFQDRLPFYKAKNHVEMHLNFQFNLRKNIRFTDPTTEDEPELVDYKLETRKWMYPFDLSNLRAVYNTHPISWKIQNMQNQY